MVSIRLQLSRFFGRFWWRRRGGWYGRFVESWAFPVVIDLVAAGGMVCVLAVLGYAAIERSLATLGWSVIVLAAYPLLLAFLTTFGASVMRTARHTEPAPEVLARLKELLAKHDFQLLETAPTAVRAVRGAGAGAESNWRSFPLEVSARIATADGSTALAVSCSGESGRYRFVRKLIGSTADAISGLHSEQLVALDKTLVMRSGALFRGGIGSAALAATVGVATLGALAAVGVSYLLATYVVEVTNASAAADELKRVQVQLTAQIDAVLRAEAERLAAELKKQGSSAASPLETIRRQGPFRSPGELILGVAAPEGKVSLLLPPDASLPPGALSTARRFGFARAGSKVLRELPQPQARELETQLGLKPGQLVVAASLSHAELSRLAPERIDPGSLEITFFDSSRPFLRYLWRPGAALHVDAGKDALPAEILASAARRAEADWTMIFRDVLWGGDVGGVAVRDEKREREAYRVFYSVAPKEGGLVDWSGVSVARAHVPALETREWVLPLAVALALIALLPVLIAAVVFASFVFNRVSRPSLRVRDALRSIEEGDYSVRVPPARGDEIGQMQAQLNRTAEALAARAQSRQPPPGA